MPSVKNLKMMVKLQASHLKLTFRERAPGTNQSRQERGKGFLEWKLSPLPGTTELPRPSGELAEWPVPPPTARHAGAKLTPTLWDTRQGRQPQGAKALSPGLLREGGKNTGPQAGSPEHGD